MARLAAAVKAYQKNPALSTAASSLLGGAPKPAPGAPPKGLPPAKGIVPPAATTPTPAQLPWDASYETTVGGINRNADSAYAGLDNEATGVKQQYGFDDVSDPYNRLKMLERAYAQSKEGTANSLAAQGQLYSGGAAAAQDELQHGHDVSYDALRRDYNTDLGAIAARRTAVKTGAEDDTTAADWVRTQTALANRPDPATLPAAKAPVAPGAKDYTERPGKDSKGNVGVWHDYKDGRKPVFVKKG